MNDIAKETAKHAAKESTPLAGMLRTYLFLYLIFGLFAVLIGALA